MAALFKNGEELARFQKQQTIEDTDVTMTLSVRSNGKVLKKVKYHPRGLNRYTGKREESFGDTWKQYLKMKPDADLNRVYAKIEAAGFARVA